VVTSDAGLLAYRELDTALGLTTMAGDILADAPTGKNGRHARVGTCEQWIKEGKDAINWTRLSCRAASPMGRLTKCPRQWSLEADRAL
jgi:hypothetical protein